MTKSPWEGGKWESKMKARDRPLAPHNTVISGRFPNSSLRTVSFFTMHGSNTKKLWPCVQLSSSQTGIALPEPQRVSEVAEEPTHRGECLLRVPLYKGKCGRRWGWGVLAWLPSRGGRWESGGRAREQLQSGEQRQLFSDPVLVQAQLLMSVSRLLSHVSSSSGGYGKLGRSRPPRSPNGSVFEAWIPTSERFTEVLGKSQEGMRGREKGNVRNKGNPRTVGSQSCGLTTLDRTMWYSVIKTVPIHSSFVKFFSIYLVPECLYIYICIYNIYRGHFLPLWSLHSSIIVQQNKWISSPASSFHFLSHDGWTILYTCLWNSFLSLLEYKHHTGIFSLLCSVQRSFNVKWRSEVRNWMYDIMSDSNKCYEES